MSAGSAIEAIEESVAAELLLVAGMASVKAVPLSRAFKFVEREDGTVVLEHEELPDAFPGAIVCVNDYAVRAVDLNQTWNSAKMLYELPVVVAIYATSDGAVLGEAQRIAWGMHERAQRRLAVFTPAGMPEGAQSMAPLKPGDFEAIPIDANTHGIASHFNANYQIEVTGG